MSTRSSGECHQSSNVLCKHALATLTFWVNLDDRLQTGVTVSNPAAECDDPTLEVVDVQVLDADTTITDAGCTVNLLADRAILVQIAGGTESEEGDETIVSVSWDQSDGDTDAVDCRLMIGGSSGGS